MVGNAPAPDVPDSVLYDQLNNPGTVSTNSQDFEAAFDAFDNFLADDFVVPAGQTWNITEVDAQGLYFNGPGPAASFNVFFYQNSGTLPGTNVYTATGQPYVNNAGVFQVTLAVPAVLTAGTYWVSVQARQDDVPAGQWGWTDRTVQSNNPAAWQNPGGGFGVGCLTWGVRQVCTSSPAGEADQMFRLIGSAAPCPTYTFSSSTGTFVPGVTNIGNSCDDCSTVISLPFPVSLYGNTYTSAAAGSNGHLTFGTVTDTFGITCWPSTQGTFVMAPYWDDQVTFNAGEGIFTTTTGTAPNRVFYVEYRTEDFNDGVPLNYEIALYQNGTPPFQYIYNTITADPSGNDSALVVGVKQDNVIFTQYGCDATGGISPPVSSGQQLTASFVPCPGSPTPTPTASPTPTCPVGDYTITTTSGTIVPGTTDSGNHADDGITTIALPFPVTFYDQSFTSVNICSNGNLQFTSTNSAFTNACLPTATMNGLIAPYWDDLYDVDTAGGQGVFTSSQWDRA